MTTFPTDTAAQRKARGAFFTPEVVARYVTEWAVRDKADTVLEPSCGEAAFLLEAGRRLVSLGADSIDARQLRGAELHAASAAQARSLLAQEGFDADISVGDFLVAEPHASFDAVIGNPPYVRYQAFSGESRAAAKRAALRAGVALTSLASSWAAFIVHSALHVKAGGRLGLVLPAEILSVNYAAPVREFLMSEFRRVRLVLFTERVFPGVMEDVVLLLAEGRGTGPTEHCELLQSRNGESLAGLVESDVRRWTPGLGDRWSGALMDQSAAPIYSAALATNRFVDLNAWGDTTLGMVTGNNAFFALTEPEVRSRELGTDDLIPLSPPGSRHLRGLTLTTAGLSKLSDSGMATWLFRPGGAPSPAARRYIREGETRGVDRAYKCRVRHPWWRVPYLRPADLLLTYMNADTARLCTNSAGVHHLNSVHGVYLRPEVKSWARDLLPLASLNSVTLLGAELVGRSYGGGVLKLEPREADRWPMPHPELVKRHASDLQGVRRGVRDLLGSGRLMDAVALVDGILLVGGGMETLDIERLRSARDAMHQRRVSRSRSR